MPAKKAAIPVTCRVIGDGIEQLGTALKLEAAKFPLNLFGRFSRPRLEHAEAAQ
jgi:hypothetical protein